MPSPVRVLILEDDPADAELMRRALSNGEFVVETVLATSKQEFTGRLEDFRPDVILSDDRMPAFDGRSALELARERWPEIPFIFVSGLPGRGAIIETPTPGATSYVLKAHVSRLAPAVKRASAQATERRRAREAEEEIRFKAALHDVMIETAPGGMLGVDLQRRIFMHNKELAAMWRVPAEILEAGDIPTLLDFVQDQLVDPPEFRRKLDELYALPDARYHDELSFKDGRVFERECAPLIGKDGTRYGRVWFFMDVTERRAAEERVRAAKMQQDAVLNNIQDMIWLKDTEGRIILANEPFAKACGVPADRIAGKTDADLWPPDLAARYLRDDLEVVREGKTLRFEEQFESKDGRRIWIETIKTPLRDARGGIVGTTGIARDVTERRAAEELVEKQLARVATLHSIDASITGSVDLRVMLGSIAHEIMALLRPRAIRILALEPGSETLEDCAHAGDFGRAAAHARIRLGQGLAGRAGLEQRALSLTDLARVPADVLGESHLPPWRPLSYVAQPLVVKAETRGVIELFFSGEFAPDEEWLDFVGVIANQVAIAIDVAQMYSGLKHTNTELRLAYDDTLEGWVHALDLRDKETEGHTRRVTEMTVQLARTLGVGAEELVHIRRGALLHDIGKLGVPDGILLKPDKLTPEEWAVMRLHPVHAFKWLSPIAFLRPALDIPHYHHERWDGGGYPDGLKGTAIPLAARLFALVDVYDALRSDRPYRKGMKPAEIEAYIQAESGKHFDPELAATFLGQLGWIEREIYSGRGGRATPAP